MSFLYLNIILLCTKRLGERVCYLIQSLSRVVFVSKIEQREEQQDQDGYVYLFIMYCKASREQENNYDTIIIPEWFCSVYQSPYTNSY